MACLTAAYSGMQAEHLPMEVALPPTQSDFWEDLDRVRSDNWFHLLNTGDEALRWRLRGIDSTSESLDLETFLWKPDAAGLKILGHILAAADRNVRVRILLDDSFTIHEDLSLHGLDEHPNIEVRIYNPLSHRSNIALFRSLFNLGEFSRINHRMHNKAMVMDGRAAIIGGRNLADEYFGDHSRFNFRDMEIVTAGSGVSDVTSQFDAFWNSGWAMPIDDLVSRHDEGKDLDKLREQLVNQSVAMTAPDPTELAKAWRDIAVSAYAGNAEFIYDLPATQNPASQEERQNQLAEKLESMIDGAISEVILITAYLIPTPELEAAIERAEARGVRVRILTNSLASNNHIAADAAYRKHRKRLVKHGAELYEVQPSARDRARYMGTPVDDKELGLHAKLMVIDDTLVFVGSCNLDPRSLVLNTEVGLFVKSAELNAALRREIAVDFEPANAWAVSMTDKGDLVWRSDSKTFNHQPGNSSIRWLEDWFIGFLPIDNEM